MSNQATIQASERIWSELDHAYNSGYRYIRLEGGTSAAKTYTVIMYLVMIADSSQKHIDITSPTMPHLKGGAIMDWSEIMDGLVLYDPNSHNRTDNIYAYESGGRIKFTALDHEGKARGPRRDILFVNEANLISPKTFSNLVLRTRDFIILDYNPVEENSWVYDRFDDDPQCYTIRCNYKDNPFINQATIREIEQLKETDENLWKVYGLGERGQTQGAVFSNWKLNYFPEEPKWIIYGLDFGYSNDPTCLVKIGLSGGELYFKTEIYEKGLTNDQIAGKAMHVGNTEIIADSSEPKSIAELRKHGLNVKPSFKGKDSVVNGINLLKQYQLNIDPSSKGAISEAKSYIYKYHSGQDRYLNEPEDRNNHFWDAVRYGVSYRIQAHRKPLNTAMANI